MRSYRLRMGVLTAAGALLIGLPMCASEAPQKPSASTNVPLSPEAVAARAAIASMPLGRVASRASNGAARFLTGSVDREPVAELRVHADVAARMHLVHNAVALGLNDAVIEAASVKETHSIPGGGSVVQFEQYVDGLHVLDASKNMVSLASSLHPAAVADARPRGGVSFAVSAESAIGTTYASRSGAPLAAGAVRDLGPRGEEWRGYQVATLPGQPRILEAAARRVLYPEGKRLVPAYHVETIGRAAGSNENDARLYVIAADDGRVLHESSLTMHEAFNYRVWADPAANHIPTDGPQADYSPHPTGTPDKLRPAFVAPILVSMEGFNKNPAGAADPWLAATATKTSEGNNVTAYSDRNDDGSGKPDSGDGLDSKDVVADINTATPRTFDRVYDVTKEPNVSTEQVKAAITQIFYVTNWLHDYWYDSGFNEKAGNGQKANLGRGGIEGDPLRAEAQDGADFGALDNANMSAASDGISPRMQMYVWNGITKTSVTTTPAVTLSDGVGRASFGQPTFDITFPAVLGDDGSTAIPNPPPTPTPVGTTTDACQPLKDVTGMIVVVERGGGCTFATKAANAQTAHAKGVIILNNGTPPAHTPAAPGGTAPTVTIPIVGLSMEDGAALKAQLAAGPVTAHMVNTEGTRYDGTIDNTVVAHEWGHYLHHRLEQCGLHMCAGMSEGWADFNALMMVVREGDNLDGPAYPLAQYASIGLEDNNEYFGIRRAPYSTDMKKNPLTLTDVRKSSKLPATAPLAPTGGPNTEIHNVGEVWAETMFEGYANLMAAAKKAVPARSFDETKRRLANYIVAAMKATPVEASFTEQRDAIMATIWASGHKDDFAGFATAFAKRGFGVGAVAPAGTDPVANAFDPQNRTESSFDDVVENFDNKGNLTLLDVAVDDSVSSCDHDGVLDTNESGKVTVKVTNPGWLTLSKSKVTVTSTDPAITFDNKGVVDVPSLEPFGSATVSVTVHAGDGIKARSTLKAKVNLADPDSFKASADSDYATLFNYDDKAASSANDDVESSKPVWVVAHGKTPHDAWARKGDTTNHVWHGADTASPSDESLVSPELKVSATAPFTIGFSHTYKFEHGAVPAADGGAGPEEYYDGAVLEISTDNGTTWEDISTYVDPGYAHALTGDPKTSTNALAGRKAYAGDLAGYPTLTPVKLDLGTKLAGKSVKVRFRIGTDDASGAEGWDIDNLSFGGITNLPFSTIVDNAAICGPAAADAGADAGGNGDTSGGTSSGCSCSTAAGHSTTGAAGLGLLGGLAMLVVRRKRAQR
jgi:MYXO-CTERM domain-containing protein